MEEKYQDQKIYFQVVLNMKKKEMNIKFKLKMIKTRKFQL